VSVDHLRWADPVSELILNSNIDAFPGATKLFFSADDMDDLNWDAIEHVDACDVTIDHKMQEIIRNRANDLALQEPPNKILKATDADNTQRYPKRQRRRNVKLQDYIVGFIATCRKQACFNRIISPELVSDAIEPSAGKRLRSGALVGRVMQRKYARACEAWPQ
jgi:hypothetical protein